MVIGRQELYNFFRLSKHRRRLNSVPSGNALTQTVKKGVSNMINDSEVDFRLTVLPVKGLDKVVSRRPIMGWCARGRNLISCIIVASLLKQSLRGWDGLDTAVNIGMIPNASSSA
ncbi:MAG: hypothetical protein GY705_01675 [Bacteroidetes bacterium]|nr:hypothetical protein [Bacteroidota bacterium]